MPEHTGVGEIVGYKSPVGEPGYDEVDEEVALERDLLEKIYEGMPGQLPGKFEDLTAPNSKLARALTDEERRRREAWDGKGVG